MKASHRSPIPTCEVMKGQSISSPEPSAVASRIMLAPMYFRRGWGSGRSWTPRRGSRGVGPGRGHGGAPRHGDRRGGLARAAHQPGRRQRACHRARHEGNNAAVRQDNRPGDRNGHRRGRSRTGDERSRRDKSLPRGALGETRGGRGEQRLMLKTEKLAAGCGDVQVLWDIDIEINEGEMVAIVGSNGAGKSTLLGALSGLVQIKGGRFSFEEEELTNESSEKLADPPEVVGFYAPGVLAILIQHLAVSLASLAVIRERLSGAYEFFEVSPLGPGELLAGQFLTYLGLVLGVNLAVAAALAAFLGIPVAAGTPEELRRRAFGGESIELTLGGEPSGLPGAWRRSRR